FSSDDETNNAAWYCYNLEVEGFEDKKGEWYLPSAGEIYNYFYTNYALINTAFSELGLSSFGKWYWSSSEYSNYSAWDVYSGTGSVTCTNGKLDDSTLSVSCLLEI
ncbi:MAG: hypothetical protein IJX20_02695, partial [Alphaproteobacteria bacterium]|nr:hypothetical protein [Alphaproteobacteria bacterium]